VVLAVLTASFGVTGYSLPWDQIGYWAVKIVTGVIPRFRKFIPMFIGKAVRVPGVDRYDNKKKIFP
jgi:quinol-cytochrome oxidoreductase complex cytochrome b subunit